jgi:hypothetical protein
MQELINKFTTDKNKHFYWVGLIILILILSGKLTIIIGNNPNSML